MKLETLGKTTWDEIKVGEVYAVSRGIDEFDIEAKHNKCMPDESIILSGESWDGDNGNITASPHDSQEIFKLPLSVQRLWRED